MSFLQLAGCLAFFCLLAIGIYLPVHEHHPLDFLFGALFIMFALIILVVLLHIKLTLYLGLTLVGLGIVFAGVMDTIPEWAYVDSRRRRRAAHR